MSHEKIRDLLIAIGARVCDRLQKGFKDQAPEKQRSVARESVSDVIYQLDNDAEEEIVPLIADAAEELGGIILIAEGIGESEVTFYPSDLKADEAGVTIIMDPIDGTRGLMYDKRSAFFLAGAALGKGETCRLSDIEVSVMVELPTSRSYLSDSLWAIKGKGIGAKTRNLIDHSEKEFTPRPTNEKSIEGGFAQLARFFPPGKDILAKIEEELLESLFPNAPSHKILTFEDQYISTGGQLYELLMGRDRFIADVRWGLFEKLSSQGQRIGHVCHPYDLASLLIAEEAGLIITDGKGEKLDAPVDTTSSVDWIGYANRDIYDQVQPVFKELLKKHGLYA